jgi:hypothetical protein
MNCPACGTQILPDQSYCRSCGADLNETALPLSASNAQDGRRGTGRFVFVAFTIMFIGAAIGVLGKILLHNDVVTVVGVLLALAGMLLAVYPFLVPRSSTGTAAEPSPRADVPFRAGPTMQLRDASAFDNIPSVIEETTDLLKTPVSPRETHDLETRR